MGQVTRVFIDTSKSVFQLHGVDASEAVVLRRQLRRSEVMAFFAKLPPCEVGLEACGASHHWARALGELGHVVKLISPQHVKPYVTRGKNDVNDAAGGCEAMSRPTMRFVPVKSAEQQAALMLAGVRESLVQDRTRLSNRIRGYAAEFGVTAKTGLGEVTGLLRQIAQAPEIPVVAREVFAGLADDFERLQARVRAIDTELLAWHRSNALSVALAEIPGVGPIGASLLVMKTPDPRLFTSGRSYAAWLGLTPKDRSTAGKTRLGKITRAGDEALRSVLVVGATSVVGHTIRRGSKGASPWLAGLIQRKPPKLVAVALANKIARIAWSMMVTGEAYDGARQTPTPVALAA